MIPQGEIDQDSSVPSPTRREHAAGVASPTPSNKTAPAAPSGALAGVPQRRVKRNGVTLDLLTREVIHRGKVAKIHRDDGVRLVAALATVMPALLITDRLVLKAFCRPLQDGRCRLQELITDVNPVLRLVGLEIKDVPKLGSTLAAL